MPNLGLTNTEGTIIGWMREDGDLVEKGDVVVEIATDKIATEIEAPESGVLRIVHPDDAVVPIAEVIGYILQPGEELPEEPEPGEPEGARGAETSRDVAPAHGEGIGREYDNSDNFEGIKASPAAKRLARELGLSACDLGKCVGSGPGGRITSDDVKRAGEEGLWAGLGACDENVSEVIPLTGIRGIVAERMTRSVQDAPQFQVEAEIFMDQLMGIREQFGPGTRNADAIRPSYTELIVKGVAHALRDYPLLNCFVSDTELLVQKHVNIGVAVGTDRGLIVPTIHDADQKGIAEICREARALAEKARDGSLLPEELMGGTFTVSNLGMFGIERFTAILYPPQAGILTVGRVREAWAPGAGEAPQHVASLVLTVDHRAIDGMMAAKFMRRLAEILEEDEIRELCGLS